MTVSHSIIYAIQYLARVINLLILVRVVFTWINPNRSNPLVNFVYNVTDPILEPIRSFIYNKLGYSGMIDFSPIIAIFLVNFIIYNVFLRVALMFLV